MPARIPPVTSTTAPEATKPILDGIKKAIGMVPNLYATIGHSPAALKGTSRSRRRSPAASSRHARPSCSRSTSPS